MSIDLKVGEIDPASVIMDVVNLPNPVYLGFTVTAYNYDDVGLYFQITGLGGGWTFSTVNLGLIGSGANLQQNLDNFCNRARPGSETSEQIQLILRAYTDAGYSSLKWTYTKTLDVWFIKSDDGSWTQDVLNNFDDGTVQGWAWAAEANCQAYSTLVAATDYVLSPAYSLKHRAYNVNSGLITRSRIYKSFTTADRTTVLAIADVRVTCEMAVGSAATNALLIRTDSTVILKLGTLGLTTYTPDRIPRNRWLRLIVPLPRNSTVELQIAYEWVCNTSIRSGYLWMDDFRIISKG